MLEGCHVFHDVPMEPYGNIDQVVVAHSGIYAVETRRAARERHGIGSEITRSYSTGKPFSSQVAMILARWSRRGSKQSVFASS